MVIKKKYHGGLKALLLLLFIMLLGMYSTCYAIDYSLPFTQTEIEQINNFYNFNYTLSDYNLAYQKLKEKYPTITKLNIFFVSKPEYVSSQYLIMAPNNGTFNNELLYTCIRPPDGSNYNYFGLFLRESAQSGWGSGWISIMSTNFNNRAVIQELNTVGDNVFYTNKSQQQPKIDNYILSSPLILTTIRTQSFYYRDVNYNPPISVFSSNYITLDGDPEPEEPSGDVGTGGTGTITNPSGEVTGQIDLSGIEQGITDIKDTISGEAQAIRDTISGETQKVINTLTDVPSLSGEYISSGDIVAALGFQFETDRYANFWYELTQGLKNAFLDSKRSIDVTFQNNTYTISLDDNFAIIPSWLQVILTPLTTCFLVWKLVKWWKLIIDKISSGNVDSILKDNAEEGISNLF